MPLTADLQKLSSKSKATSLAGYFKTGEGEYGHGDVFLGITVPEQRKVAKKYQDIPLAEVENVLRTNIHEYRFTALEILVFKYAKAEKEGSEKTKDQLVSFYLKNKKWINNWDLVDTSAPYILGMYLLDKPKDVLYKLARSKNLWDRRIAIVSTQTFIRNKRFSDTFKIAEILLNDTHDLIHKAVGWMLREVGNRDKQALVSFLHKHYTKTPRTMLRYAIERFEKNERKMYMAKF